MNQPLPPPIAILARDAPLRKKASSYPEPFASRVRGRAVRPLGDVFGLRNFGYPDDDLTASFAPDGTWRFSHKDGTPYP